MYKITSLLSFSWVVVSVQVKIYFVFFCPFIAVLVPSYCDPSISLVSKIVLKTMFLFAFRKRLLPAHFAKQTFRRLKTVVFLTFTSLDQTYGHVSLTTRSTPSQPEVLLMTNCIPKMLWQKNIKGIHQKLETLCIWIGEATSQKSQNKTMGTENTCIYKAKTSIPRKHEP